MLPPLMPDTTERVGASRHDDLTLRTEVHRARPTLRGFLVRHDPGLQTEIRRPQPIGLRKVPRLETTESERGNCRTPPKRRPADTMPLDRSLSPRGVLPRQLVSVGEPKLLDVCHPRWQERLHANTLTRPSGESPDRSRDHRPDVPRK